MTLPDYTDSSTAGLQARLSALQQSNASVPTSSGLAINNDPTQPLPINAGTLSQMSGDERDNAEKTTRWALGDKAQEAKYARGRGEQEAILKSMSADYQNYANLFGPRKLSFENGGQPDAAEALLAKMAGKYKVGNSSQPDPAPAPAPTPQPQTKPAGGMIQQAVGLLRNRSAQIDNAGAPTVNLGARYAQGGKITGPGTATSDSIPAQTGSGEPIRVANGERIVSVEQDQALERIAEMLGYESVDAMFEALTGKPVGPTIKGGGPGFSGGGKPGYTDEDGTYHPLTLSGRQGTPTPTAEDRAFAAKTAGDFNKTFSDADFKKPPQSEFQTVMAESNKDIEANNSVGAKIHHAAKGLLAAVPALAVDGYRAAAPYVAPLFTGKDYKPDEAGSQQPTPQAKPAPAAAPVPGAPAAAAPAPEAPITQPIDNTRAPDLTTKDILPGGYLDRGAGILAQRSKGGQLNVTNVGTGDLTDPNKRSVDDSASALIDQRNSTYNPARQLANMQRLRMMSDATNPEITDPAVRAQAVQGMAILNATRQGDVQEQQAGLQGELIKGQVAQAKTITDLQQKALAGDRNALTMLHALKGKTAGYKVATTSLPNPNGIGPNTQQAWGINEDTGEVFNVEEQAKAKVNARPQMDAYAKAVREHPKFKGQTLTDQQIQEMYRATYPGAK